MKVTIACVAIIATLLLLTDRGEAMQGKKVVCYYTNWSSYRQGLGKFTPSDIDPRLCTHILYSFTVLNGNSITIHDRDLDVGKGYFNQVINKAKESNPSVKVLVAIGGWNNGGAPFTAMASTPENREEFIDSVLSFLREYKFDGLDLDWEYPGLRGGNPSADKDNFSRLIEELQTAFRNFGRQQGIAKPLLSAAVGPAPKTANIAYDKRTICSELDFVNLMQYDIHGGWNTTHTGYAAPLHAASGEADPQNVIATTTQDWINDGCPRDKLILGMPLYGRGWKTDASSVPSSASGKCNKGQYTGEAGMLSYYEICEKLSNGWQQSYSTEAAQAVAYGDGQLVTYDNAESLRTKVDFLKQERLGGAMVWALDFDDFTGNFCNQGNYPLLRAINQQLNGNTPPATNRPRTSRPHRTTHQPQTTRENRNTGSESNSTMRPTDCRRPRCTKNMSDVYRSDVCDPRKYYICNRGMLYHMSCSPGTEFDTSRRTCDYPNN